MAVNVVAWNMQGEKSGQVSNAYHLIFNMVMPVLVNQWYEDTWLLYLCETGNPWKVDPKDFSPGEASLYFNSYEPAGKEADIAWTLPKNFAVRGIYCPWQKSEDANNLRCSVMIMEVTKFDCDHFSKYPRYQFSYEFYRSGYFDNLRPIVYATKNTGNFPSYRVAGVHNTATQSTAIGEINTLASKFTGGFKGACVVGDMNVSAPIKEADAWPSGLDLGGYSPVLSRTATQLSGNQLDWGFQNIVKTESAYAQVAGKLNFIPWTDSGKYSGINSSDHEILCYVISL